MAVLEVRKCLLILPGFEDRIYRDQTRFRTFRLEAGPKRLDYEDGRCDSTVRRRCRDISPA